jgi:Tol biopolymer transport system component
MRRLLFIAGSSALMACSPAVWRPLRTTEAAKELEQVTRSRANEVDPAVSPDARSLAYGVVGALDGPAHVEVMSLSDWSPGKAGTIEYSSGEVSGVEPAWRPDGSGLLFLSKRRRTTKLMEIVGWGAGQTPFVADLGDVGFAGEWPAVSPDGSTVAMSVANVTLFQTGWPAPRHLERALGFSDLAGGGIRVAGEGTEPAWSPDGKRVVFVRSSGLHEHLFVANADGGGEQEITDGPSDDQEPSWSPDGARIVFCSANAAIHATQADLFTVRPDGSGLVQLTEGDRSACHPTWARDGFIYFHVDAAERFHIWRLRARSTDACGAGPSCADDPLTAR